MPVLAVHCLCENMPWCSQDHAVLSVVLASGPRDVTGTFDAIACAAAM